MVALRPPRLCLLPALAGLCLSCVDYPLEPGCYEMTATEVLRDECGLLGSPEALWDGSIQMTGQVVRMDYGLLDMQLIGSFLGGTRDFAVDGSVANVTVRANGQECLLDQASVHLQGGPVDQATTRFEGVVRVRYDARRPDSCVCELWTRFRATHVPESATCAPAP